MYETVEEGRVVIRIKKAEKISKEMDVFYNPVMKLNRDISVLLLNAIDKRNLQIALPLAGSGIRGIRFLKELGKNKIKNISFNDHSNKAIKAIINNLKLNNIKKIKIIKNLNDNEKDKNAKIKIYNGDANLFLLNSTGFDYIDVDPFGSSNLFLESAIKRISREGILAFTNTDTAALTGTYPKACVRKYWSVPKRDYMMHETGLRILIRKIQLVGMQFEKALFPIFSYYNEHYFRIFFQCVKGKKLCNEIASEHGMFNDSGPLWLGGLWDEKLANKMYRTILKSNNNGEPMKNKYNKNEKLIDNNQNYNVLEKLRFSRRRKSEAFSSVLTKFLKVIKYESKINSVGFFDLHDIAKRKKSKIIMKKEDVIKKIKKKGYEAANTHFLGTGVRTDIGSEKFLKLLKE